MGGGKDEKVKIKNRDSTERKDTLVIVYGDDGILGHLYDNLQFLYLRLELDIQVPSKMMELVVTDGAYFFHIMSQGQGKENIKRKRKLCITLRETKTCELACWYEFCFSPAFVKAMLIRILGWCP